jgi:DNA-binding transcriptional MocR family regulator
VKTIEQELAGMLSISSIEAGMHAIGWILTTMESNAALALAKTDGINLCALSTYYRTPMPSDETPITSTRSNGILLGYTALKPAQIRLGVQQLARAWQK